MCIYIYTHKHAEKLSKTAMLFNSQAEQIKEKQLKDFLQTHMYGDNFDRNWEIPAQMQPWQ